MTIHKDVRSTDYDFGPNITWCEQCGAGYNTKEWDGPCTRRSAKIERDIGIAKVTGSNADWAVSGIKLLLGDLFNSGVEMTGEQIRGWLSTHGLPEPTHHNAWGALIRRAATLGMIQNTGRTILAERTSSHARRTSVWRFEAI